MPWAQKAAAPTKSLHAMTDVPLGFTDLPLEMLEGNNARGREGCMMAGSSFFFINVAQTVGTIRDGTIRTGLLGTGLLGRDY